MGDAVRVGLPSARRHGSTPTAEGGGQDSDGPDGAGSPQVTPSTRRAPRRVLPGTDSSAERQPSSIGSVGQEAWERSGTVHPGASIAVGQETQDTRSPTYSLSLWTTVWSGIDVRLFTAMPRAVVTSGVAWWLSIAQPTTRRGEHIQHHTAIHFALPGGGAR